jgi:UDP-2,3-diacylglucosamine pyrophosphatase LpxH
MRVQYKEMECFRGFYESSFYAAGVDLVLHGHVHVRARLCKTLT